MPCLGSAVSCQESRCQGDLSWDTRRIECRGPACSPSQLWLCSSGSTFSFCDRRRTDDLPVSSGGENKEVAVFCTFVTSDISVTEDMRTHSGKAGSWVSRRAVTVIGDSDRADPWCCREMSPFGTGGSDLRQCVFCQAVHLLQGGCHLPGVRGQRSLQLMGQEGRLR